MKLYIRIHNMHACPNSEQDTSFFRINNPDKPTMGSRDDLGCRLNNSSQLVLLPSLDWGVCRIDVVLTSR